MLKMEEKYTQSIIDNAQKMIYDLQYLGKNDRKTLLDITELKIINIIYQWAEWYHLEEVDRIKLERIMNKIILSNSNLKLPPITAGIHYSNVNTPENVRVWVRVYDNPNSTSWELVES